MSKERTSRNIEKYVYLVIYKICVFQNIWFFQKVNSFRSPMEVFCKNMAIKIFSNDIKAQFDTQLRHTIKVDYPYRQ